MRLFNLSPAICGVLVLASLLAIWAARSGMPGRATAAEADEKKGATPEAVEDDDHEFMEYVFEEPFKRLKKGLAAKPQEKAAWKAIKSESLILAECSNLLLLRNPGGEELWDETSVAVRQDGGKLYDAAKKQDLAAATAAYKSLVANCNRCHDEFGGDALAP
jgi:hypothetical protein